MTLTNADIIRNMTDEELNNFLWTFKTNQLGLFFNHGFAQTMNWPDQLAWLQQEDGFVIPETTVDPSMVYGQDFKAKEETDGGKGQDTD